MHILRCKLCHCYLFIGRGARLVKLLTDVVEYCYFSQSILSIRFNWRLSVDTRWVILVQLTMNAHLYRWSLYEP